MIFQFKTSSCHHHGTIQPVKSNAGKHAGKWVCRINGPRVAARGTSVKIIYAAPYIGAAKAAIAKFLRITVSQLRTTQSSSQGGTPILEHPRELATPQDGRSGDEFDGNDDEFDENDDEFATFDLIAAVSSARKQSPPLQKIASSVYQSQQTTSPLNPYKIQQNNTLNHYGVTGGKSTSPTKANDSTEPPQHPKQNGELKSLTLNSSRLEEQKNLDGIRKEADRSRTEKNSLQKEINVLKQQKEELEKEARIVREETERSKRESESSKQENEVTKGQTRAVREEHGKAKSDLKTTRQEKEKSEAANQEEQKKLDGVLKEADQSRMEKNSLRKEINILEQQKEGLEKEARAVREENEHSKRESESSKRENEETKGQTRAVREEHRKAKSDLKTTKQENEKYEKQARVALEEKELYEKEAKAAKESLNSHLAELESLMKQNSTAGKSAEESNSNNSREPSTIRQKAVKRGKSGTIFKSMKVVDLKEEAAARGFEALKMKKSDLLNLLVVGSTCITKTDAWGEVLRLRENTLGVVLRLREKFDDERREAKRQQDERLHESRTEQAREEREREEKMEATREKERAEEKTSQVEKHTHHFPTVHRCKLAKTADIRFYGKPRCRHGTNCSECNGRYRDAFYTCEKCDFDICQECFEGKTMTPAEKKAEAKRKAAIEKRMCEEAAERCRLQEEEEEEERQEEEERRQRWDPEVQFKSKIIDLPDKNMNPDGNKKRGFTVWCSDGFGYDGFHSYHGPPVKEFDSTYAKKEEANERARYLFHWNNPWGLEPEHVTEEDGEGEVEKSMKDGLVTYRVSPPGSTTWTVAVVPDAAYAHMENATQSRHGNDIT